MTSVDPLIGEITDHVAEGRPGADGSREIVAHALDLRQDGLLVAQDTASLGIEIHAGVFDLRTAGCAPP
jgi:hypothetical protein